MDRICKTCGTSYSDDIPDAAAEVEASLEFPDTDWRECGDHFIIYIQEEGIWDIAELYPVEPEA